MLMTAPAPLAFPGSRTLAAWWRQLAPRQPQTLWVGHLLLHHLEALIERTEDIRPEPIDGFVLKLLGLFPGASLERLDQSLHMGPQLLGQALRGLARNGLVAQQGSGWSLTALGQQARTQGEYPRTVQERRSFYFLEGEAGRAAHVLRLHKPPTEPWQTSGEWSFDPKLLEAAVAQPESWKQAHGFPLDVQKVVPQMPAPRQLRNWQRVILDRPERLLVALSVVGEGEGLLGFAIRQEGWALGPEPVLSLGSVWREVFPELLEPVPESEWRHAWHEWCQQRGLAEGAAEVPALVGEGPLLKVTATPRLWERLRALRSDALRDEAWLLVGAGRIRRAVLLKISDAEARPA
jgi:hypothetical protein